MQRAPLLADMMKYHWARAIADGLEERSRIPVKLDSMDFLFEGKGAMGLEEKQEAIARFAEEHHFAVTFAGEQVVFSRVVPEQAVRMMSRSSIAA